MNVTESNEKYLEEVKKNIILTAGNIELYSKSEDSKKVVRTARTLLEEGSQESIFASKLMLTAVLEKIRAEKIGKKQIELDRKAYDLKDISLAGLHGGPMAGLITHVVRRVVDRVTGEKEFKEKVGKIALESLESAKISEDYKKDLKEIIKERIPRTF